VKAEGTETEAAEAKVGGASAAMLKAEAAGAVELKARRLMGGRKVTLAGSKAERNSMGSGECVSSGLQMQGSRRRRAGWK